MNFNHNFNHKFNHNFNHHNDIIDYTRMYHHRMNNKCKSCDENDDTISSKVFYGIYNQEPSIIGKLLLRPKTPLINMK